MTFHYKSKVDSNYREVVGVPKVEVCQILKHKSDNFLTKSIFEAVQSVAPNIVHECPYFSLKAFNVSPPYHPILERTPSGEYKFIVNTQFGKNSPKDVNTTIWFTYQSLKDKMTEK